MKFFIKMITLLIISTVLAAASHKHHTDKKIVVDLTKQEAYAYEDGNLVLKGWISSGKKGLETPTGNYTILAKEIFHISNRWPEPDGGAEMPFMLRLTWDGIALHLGYVPNHPASHGCIRLSDGFAQELYKWARLGTKVIVKGKTPKRVSRKHRSSFYMTKYFYKSHGTSFKTEQKYLAKVNKKIEKLHIKHEKFLALKKKKRLKLLAKSKKKNIKHLSKSKTFKKRYYKKRVTIKAKLIKYYSKFSHKHLNRLIRKSYIKRRFILSSNMSKFKKIKRLKRINWFVKIYKKAKIMKYRKFKRRHLAKI